MPLVMLHARHDPAAEEVAAALAEAPVLRLAIGAEPTDLLLADVSVLVVWSRAAAALGWERFAPLLSQDATVWLVRCEAQPAPARLRAHEVVEWGYAGRARLCAWALAHADAQPSAPGAAGGGLSRGTAAGLMAAMGVLAAGSVPGAAAAPVTMARREELAERRTTPAERESRVQAPQQQQQQAARAVLPAVALAGPGPAPTPHEGALALAEQALRPQSAPAEERRLRGGHALAQLVRFDLLT